MIVLYSFIKLFIHPYILRVEKSTISAYGSLLLACIFVSVSPVQNFITNESLLYHVFSL